MLFVQTKSIFKRQTFAGKKEEEECARSLPGIACRTSSEAPLCCFCPAKPGLQGVQILCDNSYFCRIISFYSSGR